MSMEDCMTFLSKSDECPRNELNGNPFGDLFMICFIFTNQNTGGPNKQLNRSHGVSKMSSLFTLCYSNPEWLHVHNASQAKLCLGCLQKTAV